MHATLCSGGCGPPPPLGTMSDLLWFPESDARIWPDHLLDSLPSDRHNPANHRSYLNNCTAVQCTVLCHHICISRVCRH